MVVLLLAIVLLVQFGPDLVSKVFAQTTDEVSGADAQGSAEQDMAQPVTVEVSRAELRHSDKARSLAGRVEPARTVDIAFQVSGQLSDLTVDAGTRVEKGDLIAALDPVDFELAVIFLKSNLFSPDFLCGGFFKKRLVGRFGAVGLNRIKMKKSSRLTDMHAGK